MPWLFLNKYTTLFADLITTQKLTQLLDSSSSLNPSQIYFRLISTFLEIKKGSNMIFLHNSFISSALTPILSLKDPYYFVLYTMYLSIWPVCKLVSYECTE